MKSVCILLILAFTSFVLIPAVKTNEVSPYKGGMRYTAVSSPAIKAQKTLKTESAEQKITAAPQDRSAQEVWERYKALAAGDQKSVVKREYQPEISKQKEQPKTSKTGFASILDQYQESKARRSQMQTLEAPRPTLPKKPQTP